MTFGGYDTSRLRIDSNLTLAGGSDPYRAFLLGVESIKTGETELLEEPIIMALDSLVSQLWLPISTCQAFETTFGLVWNETYELYLLDEAQHSALIAQNASVTFTPQHWDLKLYRQTQRHTPICSLRPKSQPTSHGQRNIFLLSPETSCKRNTVHTRRNNSARDLHAGRLRARTDNTVPSSVPGIVSEAEHPHHLSP